MLIVMTHSRHPRRVSCQSDKRVPKLNGRCVCFALPKRRLVCRLTALVVESNLARAFRSVPSQLQRRLRSAVVQPCGLCCPMSVGALPHLADPSATDAHLPSNSGGCREPMRRPCSGFRRVFQHSAVPAHGIEGSSKTAAIVSRLVVLAAPPLVIDRCKRTPQLARRVRHNRPRATVFPGVPLFRPSVDIRIVPVSAVHLHKQRGYLWRVQDILPLRAIRSPCLLRFPA